MIKQLQLTSIKNVLPFTAPGKWLKPLLTLCSPNWPHARVDAMASSTTIPAIWNCSIRTVPPSAHSPSHRRLLKTSWHVVCNINALLLNRWETLLVHSLKLTQHPIWKACMVSGGNSMARMPCGTATHVNTFTKASQVKTTISVKKALEVTKNHFLPLVWTISTVMICSLKLIPCTLAKPGDFQETFPKESQFLSRIFTRVALTMKLGTSSKQLRDTFYSLTAHTWMAGPMLAVSFGSDPKLSLLSLNWPRSNKFTRKSSTGTSQNSSAWTDMVPHNAKNQHQSRRFRSKSNNSFNDSKN